MPKRDLTNTTRDYVFLNASFFPLRDFAVLKPDDYFAECIGGRNSLIFNLDESSADYAISMDSEALPNGFIKLTDAFTRCDGKTYNVMGVVTDYLPATRSRGTDFTVKFTIWDFSCLDIPGLSKDGMVFRFFNKDLKKLPLLDRAGNILVLRNVKTLNHGSSIFGVSNFQTTWMVINGIQLLNSVVEGDSDFYRKFFEKSDNFKTQAPGHKPDMAQLSYAKELIQAKDPKGFTATPPVTSLTNLSQGNRSGSTPRKMKYHMLQDLVAPSVSYDHKFADLFGEVRKVYDSGSNVIELSITDYTENRLLYNHAVSEGRDGDEFNYTDESTKWAGPWGRMTITVSVWDEHATFVRNAVHQKDLATRGYLLLQNVHIVMDKNRQYLQGHCRGGGRAALTVFRPREAEGDQRFKELLRRRLKYQNQAVHDGLPFDRTVNTKDDSKEEKAQLDQKVKLDNANGNKKRNAKNKEKKKRQQQQTKEPADTAASSNQHIRCEEFNVLPTSIADLLEKDILKRTTRAGNEMYLPFQNCKYRSKVKVYDFFPDKIEDFAVPQLISDYEALSDYDSDGLSVASISLARSNPERVKWTWRFYLLVGDPFSKRNGKEQPLMLLQVMEQDGDYLLNAEACDLRKNQDEFAKLKEKLFVMWGDLQEKKEETGKTGEELLNEGVQISCRPFECLIKEYGVNARNEEGEIFDDQYERMFRMFGTRIC